MDNDKKLIPTIGQHISWKDVRKYNKSGILRLVELTDLVTLDDGTIKKPSPGGTWGILTLECLEMNMLLNHQVTIEADFCEFFAADYFRKLCNDDPAIQDTVFNNTVSDFVKEGLGTRDEYMEMHSTLYFSREVEVLVGSTEDSSLEDYVTLWTCWKGCLELIARDNYLSTGGFDLWPNIKGGTRFFMLYPHSFNPTGLSTGLSSSEEWRQVKRE